MLKLLKYELIHEWRSYGIIYLIFIAACVLSPILFKDQMFASQANMVVEYERAWRYCCLGGYDYDDGDYHQYGDQYCAELPQFHV